MISISYIIIIVGVLLIIVGILGLLIIAASPFIHGFQIILKRKADYLDYETVQGKKFLHKTTIRYTRTSLIMAIIGFMCFFGGIYLGYAARGEDFWFYKKIFGEIENNGQWDRINDEGRFVASDGKEYTYYILVVGDRISLNGIECDSIEDLKERLSEIRRENTVVLVDSYAVSLTFHSVEDLLNKMGIKCIKETE